MGADLKNNDGMGAKNDENEKIGNDMPTDARTGKAYPESVEKLGTAESTIKGEEVIIDCSDEDENGSDVKENEDGHKTRAYHKDNLARQKAQRGARYPTEKSLQGTRIITVFQYIRF